MLSKKVIEVKASIFSLFCAVKVPLVFKLLHPTNIIDVTAAPNKLVNNLFFFIFLFPFFFLTL